MKVWLSLLAMAAAQLLRLSVGIASQLTMHAHEIWH